MRAIRGLGNFPVNNFSLTTVAGDFPVIAARLRKNCNSSPVNLKIERFDNFLSSLNLGLAIEPNTAFDNVPM